VGHESHIVAEFPPKLGGLFRPSRYKVLYGGRAGAKSWGIARALLLLGAQKPLRILCAREQMNSLKESVHKLLSDQIERLGLSSIYKIQQASIECVSGPGTGTQFFFEGIRQNTDKIKSYEGIDICWVEEAHNVSKSSWDILVPTIRKQDSEIWISFNPDLETDETYKRFVLNPPLAAWVQKVGWEDNPWLSADMVAEIEHLRARNPAEYQVIYGGHCRTVLEGAVYESELLEAEDAGRITEVPYDPHVGVSTFWDLGWGDATAIWFVQKVGFETRFIDYYENSRKDLGHYLGILQGRGYLYDNHWLPHDAKAKQLGTGKSIQEQVKLRVGKMPRIVPKLSLTDGINAARTLFPVAYWDRKRCADGLHALRNYRYELVEDPVKNTFSRQPVHDWTSHGADAFRYCAVGLRQPSGVVERVSAALLQAQDAERDLFARLSRYATGGAGPGTGWMK
jgi:phage terminase large subunit